MYRTKLWLTLVIVSGALALGGACGKDDKGGKKSGTGGTTKKPDKPDKPDKQNEPDKSKGSIAGTVAFVGEPPVMELLKRDANPWCAKTEMRDETVLVKDGKLADVLVRIKPGTIKGRAPKEPATVGQDNCMFRPRVQGAMPGQKLVVSNDDPTTHNVHAFDVGEKEDTLFNLAQPKGAKMIERDIEELELIKIKCDVHPWMVAYIHVSDNPYYAVSGADGAYEIKDVPPGTYTIEAWHEKYGTKTAEVEVAAGGSADPKLSFGGE